jgi:hypothetical protein
MSYAPSGSNRNKLTNHHHEMQLDRLLQQERRRWVAFSSFWDLCVHEADSVLLLQDIGFAADQRAVPYMRISHETEQGENQVDEYNTN